MNNLQCTDIVSNNINVIFNMSMFKTCFKCA